MSKKTKRKISTYLASSFFISLISFSHVQLVYSTYYSTYARTGVFDFNEYANDVRLVFITTLFAPIILFILDTLLSKLPIKRNKRATDKSKL